MVLETLRTTAVNAAFTMLGAIRADRWMARMSDWQGAVLMMHRVRPAPADRSFQPNAHLEITPDYLDTVLSRLAAMRIPVISLLEAAERMGAGDTERFAVLTLDDGYRDNFDHAYPILRRHQAPFSIFVATGMVDGTANAWWITLEEIIRKAETVRLGDGINARRYTVRSPGAKTRAFYDLAWALWSMDEPSRDRAIRALAAEHAFDIRELLLAEMMSWDQIRTLAADPLASIGGHTVSHPALAMLDTAAAEAEIRGGLNRLQAELGVRPATFAYPYGRGRAVRCRDV